MCYTFPSFNPDASPDRAKRGREFDAVQSASILAQVRVRERVHLLRGFSVDSHPAPRERIRRLQQLVQQPEMVKDETDHEFVGDLLPGTEALGEMMADVMADYVRHRIHHKHLRRQRVVQWINRRSGGPL